MRIKSSVDIFRKELLLIISKLLHKRIYQLNFSEKE